MFENKILVVIRSNNKTTIIVSIMKQVGVIIKTREIWNLHWSSCLLSQTLLNRSNGVGGECVQLVNSSINCLHLYKPNLETFRLLYLYLHLFNCIGECRMILGSTNLLCEIWCRYETF